MEKVAAPAKKKGKAKKPRSNPKPKPPKMLAASGEEPA
jgi:hypothetical protein